MKKIFLICAALVIAGCSYGEGRLQSYIDHPRSILEDPTSVGYEDKLAALERQYTQKEITYAEYLEQKQMVEEEYAREVQAREKIIHNNNGSSF